MVKLTAELTCDAAAGTGTLGTGANSDETRGKHASCVPYISLWVAEASARW